MGMQLKFIAKTKSHCYVCVLPEAHVLEAGFSVAMLRGGGAQRELVVTGGAALRRN